MKPLILVFLKRPQAGEVKTRLAAAVGEAKAVAIYRGLVRLVGEVLAVCEDAAVAVCYAPAGERVAVEEWLAGGGFGGREIDHWWSQPEGDLGERQARALLWAWELGYDRVMLLGTDCIDLDPALLQRAWGALDEGVGWVFGPAEDGGYYLAATRRGTVPPGEVFRGVRWSHRETLADCLAGLEEAGGAEVCLLPVRRDIDEEADWLSVQDRVEI